MVMQPAGQEQVGDCAINLIPLWRRKSPIKASTGFANMLRRCAKTSAMTCRCPMDHLGHIGVKSVIRLGKAYEKFNLEWIEDVIPWYYTDLLKEITDASPTPTITGEDIYEFADFEKLCSDHAVDKIHPDLATSGGILRTHKIGDMAFGYGVPMAMHFAGTPVSCMANVHCAAATRNFLALENHSLDVPWWQDLVNGPGEADHQQGLHQGSGYSRPGRHAERRCLKQHLKPGTGYFEPTPMWDEAQSWDDALFS